MANKTHRVHSLVDLVLADERVAAAQDRDAGAAVAGDLVVLDDALAVVAHEDADALRVAHGVVQHVAARVDALDDDAVAHLRRDVALLDDEHSAVLDEHRARHRAAADARLLADRQVRHPALDLALGLDRRAVPPNNDRRARRPHADQLDLLLEPQLLVVLAGHHEDRVERLRARNRGANRREGAVGVRVDDERARRALRRRPRIRRRHHLEREPPQLLRVERNLARHAERGSRGGCGRPAAVALDELPPVARPQVTPRVLLLPRRRIAQRVRPPPPQERSPPNLLVDELAELLGALLEAAELARAQALLEDGEEDVVRQV